MRKRDSTLDLSATVYVVLVPHKLETGSDYLRQFGNINLIGSTIQR